jgi:hypothetical protein
MPIKIYNLEEVLRCIENVCCFCHHYFCQALLLEYGSDCSLLWSQKYKREEGGRVGIGRGHVETRGNAAAKL